MPTIVCVVGDKGGIGKSTWARGFADLCRTNGVRSALFDADWMCRTLFRTFCSRTADGSVVPLARQDPRVGCILYDIHHRQFGRDLMLNSLGIPGVDVILHDLPAGFRTDFVGVMGEQRPERAMQEFATACRHAGSRPVFVTLLTPQVASHQSALWLVGALSGLATVVAVRNELYDDAQFALWRASDQARFVQAGGVEIAMPALDAETYMKCDVHDVRLGAAEKADMLSLADRLRAASWTRRFAAEVAPVRSLLGLDAWTPAQAAPPSGAAMAAGGA